MTTVRFTIEAEVNEGSYRSHFSDTEKGTAGIARDLARCAILELNSDLARWGGGGRCGVGPFRFTVGREASR